MTFGAATTLPYYLTTVKSSEMLKSGWSIAVGNCDLGGVIYRSNAEVTYSLGKVVNFVIYRVDIT
jgi:hypothetical protein